MKGHQNICLEGADLSHNEQSNVKEWTYSLFSEICCGSYATLCFNRNSFTISINTFT